MAASLKNKLIRLLVEMAGDKKSKNTQAHHRLKAAAIARDLILERKSSRTEEDPETKNDPPVTPPETPVPLDDGILGGLQ